MRLNATSSEQLLFYLSVIIIIIQICYVYLMLLRWDFQTRCLYLHNQPIVM